MKVKLNPMFEGASGQLGELVFREVRGKTIASRKPNYIASAPSTDQVEQRARFKEAVAFGKSVMADSSLRTLYAEMAKAKGMPIFAATVSDFFSEPVIHEIDLAAYNGQVGNVIKIRATDDFGVESVYVSLSNLQNGTAIENGAAVETAPGSGVWLYTAQSVVTAGITVNIEVAAADRPGGTAEETRTKTV